jgi:hypothetical protein
MEERKVNEVSLVKFTSHRYVNQVTLRPGAKIWELCKVLGDASNGAAYCGPEIVLEFAVQNIVPD